MTDLLDRLHVRQGIGAVRFRGLLQAFPDLQTAWNAPASQLAEAGLTAKIIENLHQVKKQIDLNEYWRTFKKPGSIY
jgi:predicted Rossmann fold nucleotide-binding protein DprA/Smf involved in DNA uptake